MKAIRIVAIVLMGLTAAVNLLGGAGTYCAAFAPEKYDTMKLLIPLQWLYQVLVFTVVATGLAGVWSTYSLVRTHKNSYATALIILIAGIVLAIVQMAASRSLRGKSMPTDLRLYVGGLALIVFLLLRLPGVWQKSGMGGPADGSGSWTTPAGLASIVAGVAALTTPLWAGASHTWDGYNWVNVLQAPLMWGGTAAVLAGAALLAGQYLTQRQAHTALPATCALKRTLSS
jgi:hypothetical protein